ncbi:MAG: iron ABC transporter permease [Phycisphaeraceae bacterium]|nr:iron ABC transporter permease [Phycisphaeraceae bacterium]
MAESASTPSRAVWALLALTGLVAVVVVARFVVGGVEALSDEAIRSIRLTRIMSGAVVGASLAVGGVFLQVLVRNPLASPDLLGLASGAGLAVTASIYAGAAGLGAGGLWAAGFSTGAAAMGASAALALTYSLARRRGMLDPVLLVLTGVAVGMICAAGTMLLRQLMPIQLAAAAERALLGSLREDVSAMELGIAAVIVACGAAIGCLRGDTLDAVTLSEDEAASVGVNVAVVQRALFIGAGLLTAGAVVLAGPIAFVGLMCPHAARALVGPHHRWVTPASALLGAAIIVGADAFARAINLPSGRLPIGVLTAVAGAPVFIYLLRRQAHGVIDRE